MKTLKPTSNSRDIGCPKFDARALYTRKNAQLTMPKKMADVHFTRMRCGWKSFEKANGRLLNDRHEA